MLTFNTNLNFQPAFGSSIPGVQSLNPGLPLNLGTNAATSAIQSNLMQNISLMSTIMAGLMSQIVASQVALPGANTFGNPMNLYNIGPTIKDFLGGILNGDGNDAKIKGAKIPGGKSLYQGKGMYHKGAPGAPNTYAFENSPAGIKFAAQHGYKSIDIDMQITKDGVPVATHWSQPLKKDGFYDPLGKIKKDAKIKDLTLEEVMRLRNKDGQSQIYPVETMIKLLKQNGIAGDFEAKDDSRFASDKIMGKIANQVRAAGIKANLKSIDRGARSEKILKKAQEHGFWVRIALDPKNGHKKNWGYGK